MWTIGVVGGCEALAQSDGELERALAKGRAQYLAGDYKGARETFRRVEALEPENDFAREFLERIEAAEGNRREATRAQLLEEVGRSWERPRVFVEKDRDRVAAAGAAPLAEKLNRIVLPNVSFTRVEIGQVVAALSAIAEEFDPAEAGARGVNIVLLDPTNKAPTVTIMLRNTTLKRVLDFVTEAVGYQYEVQADAVVVRPGGETTALETEFFPVARATVLRMTGGNPAAVRADPFSSAGASNEPAQAVAEGAGIRGFLQQAGVNFDGTPGSSLAYDGSALIVTHTARNIDRIRNILNRYNDVRQVEIEAKFMEVQEGALEELGVNWNIATKATQRNAGAQAVYATGSRSLASAFSNAVSNQQGRIVRPSAFNDRNNNGVQDEGEESTQQQIDIPIINNAPRIPGAPDLALGAGPLAAITGVIGEFDVNAVVRALSQQQGTDLLSAPKVTVLSGNPATITVAQEMRYPQSFGQTQSQVGTGSASGGGSAGVAITAGTPQEFTARNVGVELRVTPTVEEDDFSISLDLNPRVTEFDGFVEYGGPSIAISGSTTVTVPSGFYQPIFSVRDISTKVTIWDGATLVMGGLTREEVKKVNDKVPILGDLPLLGRAFRSKGESAQKRNLLIFVTANLVSPGGSPKKQHLRNVSANSIYRNAAMVTPGGSEERE
jgi:Type II secretory pathway, component PulD